tara:strand:- start:326 stop:523 length:198 start_codon:yes stop_codon:yes gene_type:complete
MSRKIIIEEKIRRMKEEQRLLERRNRDREFQGMRSNTKRIDHDYNRIKRKPLTTKAQEFKKRYGK